MMSQASCRFCKNSLKHTFVDLGKTPLANSYLTKDQLGSEPFYPLHAFVCEKCFLVQLLEYETAENIFSDYAYFSSYSESWLQHCERYANQIIDRFQLTSDSLVMEAASNDGYLLQFFQQESIPVLGIEPAQNVAEVARDKGIPTVSEFLGESLAESLHSEGKQADLVAANNVLAHVPDINDFVKGLKGLLKPTGVLTVEFPHLMELIEHTQFDTIYHEHFSYLSLQTVQTIFKHHGMEIFGVEQLPTHGGSLRIFAQRQEGGSQQQLASVDALLKKEQQRGLDKLDTYTSFTQKVEKVREQTRAFFAKAKSEGKKVAGYGAPAKGNTLLNYCGIGPEDIKFTVDKSPYKQGRYLPGSHIPIYDPEKISEEKPDYLFILPWNLKDEISEQQQQIRKWQGLFVVPIPEIQVF